MAHPKLIVGLTGGIASGKSTVARILAELGVAIVDADLLAREVVAKGSPGLREVVAQFGADVLDAHGELDRAKLAQRVFGDDEARKRLNAIIHPRIGQLSAERIALAQQSTAPYVVYEAALLVETGAHRGLDGLIVVAADSSRQLERSMARDGLDEAAARARLDAQLPLSAKLDAADYVIHNDADLATLRAETLRTHAAILERSTA
ncbi:MAG TPA: dephospho-CoA kinase, partial [Polyangiales bacterium]|nr:dephospho-CoA kinase [Polyangiales bacterium]